MNRIHLAILTPKFWPYCGARESEAVEMAEAIQRRGDGSEVLTVQWEAGWPRQIMFHDLAVTRIAPPASSLWGAFRFLRTLKRHVNDSQIEGMIVIGLAAEAWLTIRSFASRLPVVVCLSDLDVTNGDQPVEFSHRQLAALKQTERLIVDSQETADLLVRQNPSLVDCLTIITLGVQIQPQGKRSISRQGTARLSLSDAHPLLQIDPTQPLVVCHSPINDDQGLRELVQAWPAVMNRFPKAKLWILGDGPTGQQLWDFITQSGLADSIIMPGSFDDFNHVCQAADLYVQPTCRSTVCSNTIRAMASELCVVAVRNRAAESLIQHDVTGLLTSTPDASGIAESIVLALHEADLRDRLGRAACIEVQQSHDIDRQIEETVRLFQTRAG